MLVRANEEPEVGPSVWIVALFLFCALAFGIDVILEFSHEIREAGQLTFFSTLHFALELLAEAALIVAMIMSLQSYLRLRADSKHEHDLGHAIRTGFDIILVGKFQEWGLTKSEREIAILAIRGLSISEISVHRKSKEGTIKTHLHNVYVKADVGSRSDLLAKLMDELLYSHELSIDPAQTPTVAGHGS